MRMAMPFRDSKISDIGSQMLVKTSKMAPKKNPKTRKLDFQKHVFYISKTLVFEVTTPSKPTKETSQGIWSAFWHHKYEKVSQLAPKCLPMSFSRKSKIHWISLKIDLGSQKAAFGARSCTKAAKMVFRAPRMTHFPSDYQSNLIAGGAYTDWKLMSIPMMSPKV